MNYSHQTIEELAWLPFQKEKQILPVYCKNLLNTKKRFLVVTGSSQQLTFVVGWFLKKCNQSLFFCVSLFVYEPLLELI